MRFTTALGSAVAFMAAAATALPQDTSFEMSNNGEQQPPAFDMIVGTQTKTNGQHVVTVDLLRRSKSQAGAPQELGHCVITWHGDSVFGAAGDCLNRGRETGYRAMVAEYTKQGSFKVAITYQKPGWLSNHKYQTPAIDLAGRTACGGQQAGEEMCYSAHAGSFGDALDQKNPVVADSDPSI